MTSQVDSASQLLSECLLKGMVMTSQICSVCEAPLMRNRASKKVTCVVCEKELCDAGATKPEAQEPLERHLEPEQEGSEPVDVSGLLSQRMLQGWALLETLCPSCPSVPLVRNKDKYSYCVNCDKTFVLESDFDPKLHNLSMEQKPKEASATSNEICSGIRDAPVKTKATAEPFSDISTAPPRHKLMRKESSFESAPLLETLTESGRVLHFKLSHLNEKLANASDPQQIVLISGSIKACIDALASSITLKNILT